MKKSIFNFGAALLMAGTIFTSCQSSATKVENANDKVDAANDKVDAANDKVDAAKEQVELAQQELNQAIKDSIRQFKEVAEAKILDNEQNIAEFKVRIAKENYEARVRDEKKLAELEQQNRKMRQNLAGFNEEQRDQWLSFREKFNRDMEKQQSAFKDFWGIRK